MFNPINKAEFQKDNCLLKQNNNGRIQRKLIIFIKHSINGQNI